MAGSYLHCCKEDDDFGEFVGDDFEDMIENLGDAYEACEEMHFMINYLAGGDKEKIKQACDAFVAYSRRKHAGID